MNAGFELLCLLHQRRSLSFCSVEFPQLLENGDGDRGKRMPLPVLVARW